MNFTSQERIDLLNNNGWSKNDVRQLIRDCEELELQLKAIQVEAKVKVQIAEMRKQFNDQFVYNQSIEGSEEGVFYMHKYSEPRADKSYDDLWNWVNSNLSE